MDIFLEFIITYYWAWMAQSKELAGLKCLISYVYLNENRNRTWTLLKRLLHHREKHLYKRGKNVKNNPWKWQLIPCWIFSIDFKHKWVHGNLFHQGQFVMFVSERESTDMSMSVIFQITINSMWLSPYMYYPYIGRDLRW